MIDPPKPEVENSIREAVELGIKTGHDYWRSSVNCTPPLQSKLEFMMEKESGNGTGTRSTYR